MCEEERIIAVSLEIFAEKKVCPQCGQECAGNAKLGMIVPITHVSFLPRWQNAEFTKTITA